MKIGSRSRVFAIVFVVVMLLYLVLNNSRSLRQMHFKNEMPTVVNDSSTENITISRDYQDEAEASGSSWISTNLQKYLNVSILQDVSPRKAPYAFVITPWRVLSDRPRSSGLNQTRIKWFMAIFIKSQANHFAQRERARSTWARYEFVEGLRLGAIFILGATDSTVQEKIRKENESYGDILQTGIADTYRNLVHKTVAGMQYASQYFPATWFYASADDDVMPDIASVKDYLLKLIKTTNAIIATNKQSNCTFTNEYPIFCGFGFNFNSPVFRAKHSKWYVPNELYSHNLYPTYCNGAWYVMSVKLAKELYTLSRYTNYFWIDDVWITGLLRLKHFTNLTQGCFLDDVNVGLWSESRKVAHFTNKANLWTRLEAKIRNKPFVLA